MIIDEEWRVTTERIEEFFASLPDTSRIGAGLYECGLCRVRIEKLENYVLGSLSFPNTRVRIEGSEEETEALYKKFFYTFISAGG